MEKVIAVLVVLACIRAVRWAIATDQKEVYMHRIRRMNFNELKWGFLFNEMKTLGYDWDVHLAAARRLAELASNLEECLQAYLEFGALRFHPRSRHRKIREEIHDILYPKWEGLAEKAVAHAVDTMELKELYYKDHLPPRTVVAGRVHGILKMTNMLEPAG